MVLFVMTHSVFGSLNRRGYNLPILQHDLREVIANRVEGTQLKGWLSDKRLSDRKSTPYKVYSIRNTYADVIGFRSHKEL